jgi:hypothetical protein
VTVTARPQALFLSEPRASERFWEFFTANIARIIPIVAIRLNNLGLAVPRWRVIQFGGGTFAELRSCCTAQALKSVYQ